LSCSLLFWQLGLPKEADMFGLRKFLGSLGRGARGKEPLGKAGVQLLGAMLVCYPEISTVAFEPRDGQLVLGFVVRAPLPARPDLEKFAAFLNDSVQAYHELEESRFVCTAIEAEAQNNTLILRVRRALTDFMRGELELIVTLMRDRFGEQLVVDRHSPDNLEPDFADLQSEILDQMLEHVQEIPIGEHIVGVRENDRVVIYNC